MTHKRDDYGDFQDRMFQELRDLSDVEKRREGEFWELVVKYANMCGLTGEELSNMVEAGLLKPGMSMIECLNAVDAAGKNKKKRPASM